VTQNSSVLKSNRGLHAPPFMLVFHTAPQNVSSIPTHCYAWLQQC